MNIEPIQNTRPEQIRRASAAGGFYPAGASRLRVVVDRLLDDAGSLEIKEARGILSPHAGYLYSGHIAACAHATLPENATTVYLLGPPHFVRTKGAALSGAAAFETPLGLVQVAKEIVADLLDECPCFGVDEDAHAQEHSLEVQLPFLQRRLRSFRIVPILVDVEGEDSLVEVLSPRLASDPLSVIVASSDLSHFYPSDIAEALDLSFMDSLVHGDIDSVRSGHACGRSAATVLAGVAQRLGWRPHALAYANSGDVSGDWQRVVGYAGVAYVDGRVSP